MAEEKSKNKSINIHVDTKSILMFFLVMISLYFVYLIRDVLVLIFLGSILALALEPTVVNLRKRGLPHSLAVLTVILLTIAIIGILGSLAFTPFIQQTRSLVNNIPFYVEKLLNIPGIERYTDTFLNQLNTGVDRVFSFTLGAFSGVLSFVVMIVFTIYLLLDFDNFRNLFVGIFPPKQRPEVKNTLSRIEAKLTDWLRGQVILMFIIGLLSYIGLLILGLEEYALALAVIAGLLEIIPVIGPILSVVPAAIIGFTISPALGIGVVGLYTMIQQLENHIIVPKVMQKAVGLNPLVTIVAFMVGAQLMGVLGAILSLPVLIIISEIVKGFVGYEFSFKNNDKK